MAALSMIRSAMNYKVQFGVIALAAMTITSGISHFVVRWLHIRTVVVSHRIIGDCGAKPFAYLAGSSLMLDALSVDRVSMELRHGIETWFVAGSSPSEWEPFQSLAPDARITLVGVSAYDLNEEFLCDFRSEVVPLGQAVRDLAAARSSWPFITRVLSEYPLQYLRILFPTAGRSDGVMGGLKEQLREPLRPWIAFESDVGPKVPLLDGGGLDYKRERISDWSAGYLLRSVEKLRSACQDRHSFDGTKNLALLRILERGRRQGRVIVVVLPVSAAYKNGFFTAKTVRKFEDALHAAQLAVPDVFWIRLDQIPQLSSNEYFWDVVHLNTFGQQIATDAFLEQMRGIVPKM